MSFVDVVDEILITEIYPIHSTKYIRKRDIIINNITIKKKNKKKYDSVINFLTDCYFITRERHRKL